jgi:hypothetical protein
MVTRTRVCRCLQVEDEDCIRDGVEVPGEQEK